jgi:predicted porin
MKSDYKKFSGIEESTRSASVLGVRGEEALGNGLKAIFDMQWRIRADEGSYAYKASGSDPRWAFVGLSGGFGAVKLGRNKTPFDDWSSGVSAAGWTGITPANALSAKVDLLVTGERWNNSIAYESPNFSGFQVKAIYSFGEKVNGTKNPTGGYGTGPFKSADLNDASRYEIGLRYANGPLTAVAIYEARLDDDSVKPFTGISNAGYGAKAWLVGGAYDFKVVKLYASYQQEKYNDDGLAFGLTGAGDDKQKLWQVGLTAPVTKQGYVFAEYGQYKDYLKGGLRDGYTGTKTAGSKTKSYSIGYIHSLSKRTSVHAYYTHFDQDTGINGASGSASKVSLIGEDQNVFAVGIKHAL